jgi:sigma-E factor negative regulatory protein RseA
MSQQFEEQLSAFMDGELGRDEARFLLKRVEGDGRLVQRWTRYHVVRQALRRQEIVVLRSDFSSALMARLDAEDMPQAGRSVWLRWGSGGAIAAAVAVAALMVTKPVSEPDLAPVATANSARPLQAVPTTPAPAQIASTNPALQTPLVPNSPIQTTVASFGTDVTEPGSFDPRLQQPYVVRHYQATGSTVQPDFAPYILLPVNPEPRQAENR